MPYGGVGSYATYRPTNPRKTPAQRSFENAMVAATMRAERARFGSSGRPATSRATAAYAAAVAAQETKYFDTAFNGAVTWAGTDWSNSELPMATYVNSSGASAAYTDSAIIPSANGSAYGQVDGTKYKLMKVRVRGTLNAASLTGQTAVTNAVKVRILLVEDLMPAGSQAQGEDVLQDVGGGAENLHSFLRIPNGLGKFRILADKTMVLNPVASENNAAATTVSQAYQVVKFKLQHNWKVPVEVTIKAGNATPTIAGLISRNVFMLVAGWDMAAGAVEAITCQGTCRAYYKD